MKQKKRLAEIEAKYGSDIDLAGLRKQLDARDGELRSASDRETATKQGNVFCPVYWMHQALLINVRPISNLRY